MAKSKHHKRTPRRGEPIASGANVPSGPVVNERPAFFEAMPALSMLPALPATPPELGAEARRELGAFGSELLTYARAIAKDMYGLAQGGRRIVWNRRTRSAYLAVVATVALGTVIAGSALAVSTFALYSSDISSPSALLNKKKVGTTILDRNGQVLFEGFGAQDTKVISLGDIPKTMRDATLAAEDPSFYSHPGFSWRATARAAVVDLTHHGKVEGGSTLTQQLVKNTLLNSHKTFERKYQELLLSMELERKYSKDQILEMYLNEVYYGQSSSGVEAAAQTFFHKPAAALTLSESAMLAGMPLGPNRFDPNTDIKSAAERRNYVLQRMADLGKITPQAAHLAQAEKITANAKDITLRAPHFVFYVLDQLRAKYGDEALHTDGMTVQTTLDITKQELGEQIVRDQIDHLAGHHATNGGLVSLEPATGDIIAMVGSVDYNAPGFGNVNVITSNLQPGSSFKPIAYAAAFKKGWNGATQVDDKPLHLPNGDGTMYEPQNYDQRFRGKVTLRRALANSLNIPAIEVLQYAGIRPTIDTAHAMGISTLNEESRYGMSLVLGGGEVKPIDMATVYATFANQGTHVAPRAIIKVANRYGKDITKPIGATSNQKVLDPRIAYMLTNILSDNAARTEEFGPNSPLKLSRPAAAKTGTTNDFRDNWTVGYTPGLVAAVWVGNNDHTAMANIDGITGAAPIWHDFMEGALAGTPIQPFPIPAGVSALDVCPDGGLANPWDHATTEIFLTESQPTKHCNSFLKLFNDENRNPHRDQTPLPTPDPGLNPDTGTLPPDQTILPIPKRNGRRG